MGGSNETSFTLDDSIFAGNFRSYRSSYRFPATKRAATARRWLFGAGMSVRGMSLRTSAALHVLLRAEDRRHSLSSRVHLRAQVIPVWPNLARNRDLCPRSHCHGLIPVALSVPSLMLGEPHRRTPDSDGCACAPGAAILPRRDAILALTHPVTIFTAPVRLEGFYHSLLSSAPILHCGSPLAAPLQQ